MVFAQGRAEGLRVAELARLKDKTDAHEIRLKDTDARLVSMDRTLAVVASNMANMALAADKTSRLVEKIWERARA